MNETNKQMPLEIWTDINGHATRTQFNGGVRYIRAAEYDALREQNRVLREALQAWMVYYEGHSTADNRDRAYFMAQAALTATSQPKEPK